MANESSAHAPNHRLRLAGLAVLALLLLLLAVAVVVLPGIAGRMIERALADAGFPETQVHDVSLIWFGLEVDRVDLAPDGGAGLDDILARGTPAGLLAGRLDSLSIGALRLDVGMEDAGLGIAGYVPGRVAPAPPMTALPVDRIAIETVILELGLSGSGMQLAMNDLHLTATDGGVRLDGRVELEHAEGRLTGMLEGEAGLPLVFPKSDLRLGLDIADARWGAISLSAGRFGTHLLDGMLDWSLNATGADSLAAGLRGRLDIAAETLRLTGDLGYRDLALRGLDMSAQQRGDALSLTLASAAGSDVILDMTAAYDVATGKGSLRGEAVAGEVGKLAPLFGAPPLRGQLRLAPDLALTWKSGASLSASGALALGATDVEAAGVRLDGEIDVASADGDAPLLTYELTGDWRLSADMRAALTASTDALRLESLTLDGALGMAGDMDSIQVNAPGCLSLALMRVEAVGLSGAELSLPCLRQASDQPLVQHDLATGVTQLSLHVPETAIAGELSINEQKPVLTGRWPAVDVALSHRPGGDYDATLSLKGGAISAAASAVGLSRVKGEIAIEHGALKRAEVSLGRLTSTASPALFAPMTLDVEAQAGQSSGQIDYTAFLSDTLGSFVIRAEGAAGPGRGNADLTLFPVRFVTNGLEIGDVSPKLAEMIDALEGEIGATAALAWEGESLTRQTARVTLDGLAVAAGGVAMAGLNADIRFSGLWPLATPGPQTLRLDAVTAPIPLSNGRFSIDVAGERLSIDDVDFTLAGGRVRAAPFILDLSGPRDIALTMRAEDISLEDLFRLADVEGLSGEGRLAGRLPLRLDADGAYVKDGILETTVPGVLRYSPESLPDFLKGEDMRTKMLRQALANFRYDALSLYVDGGTTGAQTIRLEVTGRNPDFMEGHPVELAFNLQGALFNSVRSAAILSKGEALRKLRGAPDRE